MVVHLFQKLLSVAAGIVALVSVTAVGLMLAAPSASAATRPFSHVAGMGSDLATSGGASRLPATIHGPRAAAIQRPGAAAVTITCTLPAPPNPFEFFGGPSGGGEEGIANISCTGTVYEIQIVVGLFLNGTEVSANSNTVFSTTTASADTTYPLSSGNYETCAIAQVTWTFGGSSSTTPVVCGNTVNLP